MTYGLRRLTITVFISTILQPWSGAQAIQVLEKAVDHFEPKVQTSAYLPPPIWLNNHQLVASVFKKGAKLELYDKNDPVDTVLIDFQKKSVEVLAEGVFAWNYTPETRVLVVGRVRSEFPSNEEKIDRFKELILEEDGTIKILKSYNPGSFPFDKKERPPKGAQVRSAGLQDIGFFLKVPFGAGEPGEANNDNLEGGDGTLWVRPGKPSLPLKMRFKDFSSSMEAVLFAGGYLLDIEDTYGKPFRLLRGDGEIELIPYPEVLYSLRYPANKNGSRADFVYLSLTRSGLLARQIAYGENRLYLLKGNTASRLTGEKALLGMFENKLILNGIDCVQVGPDGCNVAYQYIEPRWGQSAWSGAYSIAIFSVCEGGGN